MSSDKIKKIGLYALSVLAMARFILIPLHGAVKDKKALLKEREETYRMKTLTVERHKTEAKNAGADKIGINAVNAVYPKDYAFTSVQSDLAQRIIAEAEKRNLDVLSFELPDIASSGSLSEVAVVIKMQGEMKALLMLLKELEKEQKALKIKQFEITKTSGGVISTISLAVFRAET